MKRIVFFLSLVILCVTCQKEVSQPAVEPGIYEACQQGFSEIITVTKSSSTGRDDIVIFKSMEERFKFPSVFDGINFEEGRPMFDFYGNSIIFVGASKYQLPLEYVLTVGENGKTTLVIQNNYVSTIEYIISEKQSQIWLSAIEKDRVIRFSPKLLQSNFPIDDVSLIVLSNDRDYKNYSTIQGEIQGETIILYLYDARISRGSSTVSSFDTNYIDIERIRDEMEQDDILEFVKKAIYFKKKV